MHEHDVEIGRLVLENGEALEAVSQRVTIYGNEQASQTVLVCHALTGSSRVAEWWPGIAGGSEALFSEGRWRIVGINTLGSCYGSSGPAWVRAGFPRITVGDIVRAQSRALSQLGIDQLDVVIGGSLGGMQALQWVVDQPARARHAIVVGAHDHQSPMAIALNAVQREAIELKSVGGLRLARKIAMLSYKSEELFNQRHGRSPDRRGRPYFDVEGYLDHQADLFEQRMVPAAYVALTHAMDSFDLRECQTEAEITRPRLTFVGISSDWLFRPIDVLAAARRFARCGYTARYIVLESDHGHDAFLAESQRLSHLLRPLLTERSRVSTAYS